ncbi:MAG TPA: nucleotidyltransferase substrate binding protein [Sphingobacteriaceae bacterium]
MEPAERYKVGLGEFGKAVVGFEQGMAIDLTGYSAIEADLIRNGCIQKFEYCAELAWKLGKVLLKWQTGQDYSSPKPVYRALFAEGYLDEELCIHLLETIDDRNSLSHIYKEELFEQILEKLPTHVHTLLALLKAFKSAAAFSF